MTAANETTVNFDAVAFGGNYGGHNVNVKISDEIRNKILKDRGCSDEELEELISEVQRKMLNNDMIVEYDKLAPQNENSDGLGNIGV